MNTIKPIFENNLFGLKGGRVNFWVKMLIPRTHFLKILTPFMGSIYIATLIFTRNIIISVKIEFSLRLSGEVLSYPGCSSAMYSGCSMILSNPNSTSTRVGACCHSPTQPQQELELDLIMVRNPPPPGNF